VISRGSFSLFLPPSTHRAGRAAMRARAGRAEIRITRSLEAYRPKSTKEES
jgi:hypothetical protein